ncbi:MAG: GNAT family N-acetyltransferase [Ruminococcus sp.]|nr:GNAT family N-acetyltransferase [Ruminococcus sp.]
MLHHMKLREAPFKKIKNGSKTIELRLNDEKRQKVQVGDFIEFSLIDNPKEKIQTRVTALHRFDRFQELYATLPKEKLGYTPSDTPSSDHMNAYYSNEEQERYGVIGIEIEVINMIEYKIAARTDIQELTRLRIEYMKEAFNGITNEENLRLNENLPAYFDKHLGKNCVAFIAKEKNCVISCALLIIIEKPYSPVLKTGIVGEVTGVYTEPNYRNKGIATKLMSNMVEYAKDHNMDRIDLDASADGLHVYRKVGFIETDSPYVSMRIKL